MGGADRWDRWQATIGFWSIDTSPRPLKRGSAPEQTHRDGRPSARNRDKTRRGTHTYVNFFPSTLCVSVHSTILPAEEWPAIVRHLLYSPSILGAYMSGNDPESSRPMVGGDGRASRRVFETLSLIFRNGRRPRGKYLCDSWSHVDVRMRIAI